MFKPLAFAAIATLLAGCATGPAPSTSLGYAYYDGQRSNAVVAPSQQALYNAGHGVWLWPPAENGRH